MGVLLVVGTLKRTVRKAPAGVVRPGADCSYARRRTKPLPSFVVVMTAMAMMSAATGGTEAGGVFLMVLVATYSAVAYGDRAVAAAVVAVAALAVHDARDPYIHTVGDHVFAWIFL